MSEFVHLHVHSEYSLLDGAARIEELVDRAEELGMTELALTDHGVMYGAIPFYKACRERGIKPIIGCEIYVTAGSMREKLSRQDQPIHHLILLAKNETGYRNLMRICSEAQLRGFHYKPRADRELLARHAEGLVCLSSCLAGEVSYHLMHGRAEEAEKAALRYRAIFGDDFYLELQDHGLLEQKKVLQGMLELHRKTSIPLVVTNDVHYVRHGEHVVQDCLLCIGTGKTIEDKDRLQFQSDQLYLKSGEEMARLFAHVPEALANTRAVADKCELAIEFGRSILPEFRPLPEGETASSYLGELCRKGLAVRYEGLTEWQDPAFREKAVGRLDYELGVIEKMGFSDYFLIVWDFVRFAHERGIVTGPGRGSSAGSLVAYVLRITDVDPIKYGLLFERFLNPERVTMPDIDIDFSDIRRDEVIDYVVTKYGSEHVAQIITFGTMAAKAAVRDVGRVMNVPYGEVDRAAKMIPSQLGITIEEALRVNPDLRDACVKSAKTAELIDMAMKVEGFPRHASTHAAGVVISREPLTHYVPLQEGTEKVALTQYSMEHLEALGLLKMDFLGLRYLSIIERTLQWIDDRHGVRLDFHRVSYEDPATYALLGRGDTTGIFQLESPGMRRVLRDLRPSAFEDIISVLALYRPGPMEFIPKYVQAKHGLIQVEYPHESLKPILEDTYGIIVYQEQIMQIASHMAGFSLGEADLLRRAVSKKKREVLDEQRAKFVQGSIGQGYAETDANKVYDMIVRFADYGFPRAHATAYGVLAFQTAYLKTHYPVEFMASMLTSVMGSHRKVAEYVEECRRMGIPVLPPDVNESDVLFTPVRVKVAGEADGDSTDGPGAIGSATGDGAEGKSVIGSGGGRETGTTVGVTGGARAVAAASGAIRFGLAAIKNVGTHAMETIIAERKDKPYQDLADYCRRVDLRVCNKRVIESLIQGGAMDELPGHRAQLVAVLDEAVEAAAKWKKDREDLQLHLFGFTEDVNWTIEYPDIRPYGTMQQLELERELLGLYLSGHPLDAFDEQLADYDLEEIHELPEYPDGQMVLVAGLVVAAKTILTKKGLPMAFIELENRIAKAETVLFPETWKQNGSLVQKGEPLLVLARLQHQDEDVKLLAERVASLRDPGAVERARGWRREPGRGATAQEPGRGRPGGAARAAAASRGPEAGGAAPRPGAGAASANGAAPPAAPGGGLSDAPSAGGSRAAGGDAATVALPKSGPGAVPSPHGSALASERPARESRRRPAAEAAKPSADGAAGASLPVGPTKSPEAPYPDRTAKPGGAQPAQAGPAQRAAGSAQKVYVKIRPEQETTEALHILQALLKLHPGTMEVVLYYERERKWLALSEQYRVDPSAELIKKIGDRFGAGSTRVK